MVVGQLTSIVKDIYSNSGIQGAVVVTLDGSIAVDTQTTDSSGAFTTRSLNLGSYELQITKAPYKQITIKVLVTEGTTTLASLYLEPLNLYGQKQDGSFQPLSTNNMNALLSSNQLETACRIGVYYGVTTGAQTVAGGDYFAFQLTNPSDSGKTVHLGKISGGSTGRTIVDVIRDGAFDSGTSLPITNRNYAYPNSNSTAAKGITQTTDPITSGDVQVSIVQSAIPMVVDLTGEIIIPPNHTMAIRTSNTSAQENILTLTVTWWEESV